MFKKLIALLLSAVFLMASLGCSFIVFAANSVSVDSFIDSVEELNEEETEEKKTLEESVGSRVIVKALQKPETFGNAEYFKGTFGKHIFQYATEEEALTAVEYYSSLSGVTYAVRDNIVNSFEVPYSEAMLGTQRAKEYIANNNIPTDSVKVAVIDTGIDFTHDLFKENARVVDSGMNVTDSGYSQSSQDDEGHGSLCTELILKNTSDDISVVGYKALNSNGSGSNLWIATAIEKAIEDKVDVINLSLGGFSESIGLEETSIVLDDAVRLAISKGIIVVAASGNDGQNAVHTSPANVEGVVTIGAIDKAGNRAYFSNFGDCVDFVAPGVDIEHEYIFEFYVNGEKDNRYHDKISGTSFSCPYVVSEIATLLCVYEHLSRDEVVTKLSAACVPYEHLTYHDGFHPIEEDQGVYGCPNAYNVNEWYEEANPVSICYGNGMPQVDLAVEYENEFEREITPAFSVDSGHYVDVEYDLFLSSSANAEIYYTQDESYPTKENGIKYETSIHLDELQSVRAVAFSPNKAPSYFDAREYFFEYHISESELTVDKYYNYRVTGYTGTRNNVIVPETVNGVTITHVGFLETPNASISSMKLPATVVSGGGLSSDCSENLVMVDAVGLERAGYLGRDYPSLVKVNLPNARNVVFRNSNVRELNLPKAVTIVCNGCHCLRKVIAPSNIDCSLCKFSDCFSLSEVEMPNLTAIGYTMFQHCFKLSKINLEKIKSIDHNGLALCYSIKELWCPDLTHIMWDACPNSAIKYVYAPKLEKMDNAALGCGTIGFYTKFIVSSAFKELPIDASGDVSYTPGVVRHFKFLWDFYGTPGTFAEEYANKYDLNFIPLPLMQSAPDSMRPSNTLSVDVLGFNLEYQWYGSNIPDNRTGQAIEGATDSTFVPADSGADYDFYYCVINSSDGDYHKTLVTGERKQLDLNGDGVIDIADLSLLLHYYGQQTADKLLDINEDGIIDVSDLTVLLMSTVYGTTE